MTVSGIVYNYTNLIMNKILKVGFDMDGVILKNPIRFIRPIAKIMKPVKALVFKQNRESFYFPSSPFEKWLFSLLHLSSFMVDSGISEIEDLVKSNKIEAYIVSGRYSFLKGGFDYWVKKSNSKNIFKGCFQNDKDLQPNLFKANMIKKLGLDIYVEDNWDIVNKLKIQNPKVKVLWITNWLDKFIAYPYKFSSLKKSCQFLKRHS